ncbi:MAG: PAS domain-containing protein [Victivallaceae bacterium]|nr:PAS domain-containing protein [Victivallaceae bacterium]
MQDKEQTKELDALREENARLKEELSACSENLANELRLKETQLYDAYKLTDLSVWSYDFKNDQLTPSRRLKEIWTPPAKNIKDAFFKRIPAEDKTSILQAMEDPAKFSSFDFPFRIVGDDGNMYYLLCRCAIERDENGEPAMAHGITWDITEKKLQEKQNQQTENHLRLFFEKIGLGFWEYNADSDEIFAGRAIRRFAQFEHKNEIVTKEEFFAKIHFQDLERVKNEFEKVLKVENSIFDCIFRLRRRDGKYVWILSRGIPIFGSQAKVHKVLVSIEELSRSKRYNALKERLQLMQDIADALPVPVYYKDLKGRYIGYNEAFRELPISDNRSDKLIGTRLVDHYFEDNKEMVMEFENDEKYLLENPHRKVEKTYALKTQTAGTRVIVDRKSILFDPDNKPKYIVGGVVDVTDMKIAEDRLQQTKERLNTTLNAMNEMVMCFDEDLNLEWANQAAQLTFADKGKSLIGSKWYEIWENGKDIDYTRHPVYNVLVNQENASTDTVHTKDGRIYEVRAYPLHSNGKRGVVEIALDITEHEAMKAAAEMHREQLMLADKMKSLGILISGVAHEINNPNNFININVTLLQKMWNDLKPLFYEKINSRPDLKLGNITRDKLEQSIEDLLFGIKDGSERINRIIESLKAYIRNVPSKRKEIFDLHRALENVIFLLKNQIKNSTNKFKVERKCRMLPAKGVQQQIEQVIMNILQNACQALTSRNQAICIETAANLKTGHAIIRITDEGCGITAKNLKHITEPFFTTKRERGGTGLGLSISSSILKEHKGRFKFKSRTGKGTVAEIILPLPDDVPADVITGD